MLLALDGAAHKRLILGTKLRRPWPDHGGHPVHLRIMEAVMTPHPQEVKHAMVRRFGEAWLDHLAKGTIRPVIDSIFTFDQAPAAHRHRETKVILNANLRPPA